MYNPTEVEKAWMAGFLDGEGCFTIGSVVRPGRPSPAYRTWVQVSNTIRSVLELFERSYGGRAYETQEKRSDKNGGKWADAYTWYCPVAGQERLIHDLLPYFRLKREQALVVLEFFNGKKSYKRPALGQGKGSAPLSFEEIAHRESLRVRIHLLNSKGRDFRKRQLNLESEQRSKEAI